MTNFLKISSSLIINSGNISSIELTQGERLRKMGYVPEVKGLIRVKIRESTEYSYHYDIFCYSEEEFNNKITSLNEILEVKELEQEKKK